MELDSGDSGTEVVVPEMDAGYGIHDKVASSDTDLGHHLEDVELQVPVLCTAVDDSKAEELSKDTEECQMKSSADETLQEETTECMSFSKPVSTARPLGLAQTCEDATEQTIPYGHKYVK